MPELASGNLILVFKVNFFSQPFTISLSKNVTYLKFFYCGKDQNLSLTSIPKTTVDTPPPIKPSHVFLGLS